MNPQTRPGVKTQFIRRERERTLPLFLLRSLAGWCHLSPALRRSYYCSENVKSERDPRLLCTTRKKVSALCTGCFISIRPCQSFEFNSNVIAMSGFKVHYFSSKLWAYVCVCIVQLSKPRQSCCCCHESAWNMRGCGAKKKKKKHLKFVKHLRKGSLCKCSFSINTVRKTSKNIS